ncbi:ester cyclase [Streptomyces sp. NPDC052051]|uniref:ester cyclase n=1 Tax=Streptomyces sp. NPDC052051 TaxID=3154649 RepID=UPI00344A7713
MMLATEIHRRQWEAVENHDWEGMRGLYHPEYVYTDNTGRQFSETDTPVAMMRRVHTAFPDLRFSYRAFHSGESDAVSFVEVVCRGTHLGPLGDIKPTGETVVSHACHVIEVRDRLIYREREYFDSLSVLRQIGAMPEH